MSEYYKNKKEIIGKLNLYDYTSSCINENLQTFIDSFKKDSDFYFLNISIYKNQNFYDFIILNKKHGKFYLINKAVEENKILDLEKNLLNLTEWKIRDLTKKDEITVEMLTPVYDIKRKIWYIKWKTITVNTHQKRTVKKEENIDSQVLEIDGNNNDNINPLTYLFDNILIILTDNDDVKSYENKKEDLKDVVKDTEEETKKAQYENIFIEMKDIVNTKDPEFEKRFQNMMFLLEKDTTDLIKEIKATKKMQILEHIIKLSNDEKIIFCKKYQMIIFKELYDCFFEIKKENIFSEAKSIIDGLVIYTNFNVLLTNIFAVDDDKNVRENANIEIYINKYYFKNLISDRILPNMPEEFGDKINKIRDIIENNDPIISEKVKEEIKKSVKRLIENFDKEYQASQKKEEEENKNDFADFDYFMPNVNKNDDDFLMPKPKEDLKSGIDNEDEWGDETFLEESEEKTEPKKEKEAKDKEKDKVEKPD